MRSLMPHLKSCFKISNFALLPKLIGGYSGTMVTAWGYEWFFLATTLMGVPVLLLIWLTGRRQR